MTKQIHSGIAAGQVPEGYKLEHGYVIPKEWKVVHFNECFHRLTQKNTENNQNVLTISAQQGLISQLDYYNTPYASEDKTGYFLLQKGNFAYNKSYSADYAYGAIKQLEKYDKGIVSPLYICFSANKGTNTDFYRQYFEAGMFNREIYKIAQEGARNHGLLNVSTPEFFSAALVFPPVDEQKKIAEILSCCDRVIELKQQLIAELQRLKSGFLQAMFPAKGHSEPVIRFPEFSDAWEQRKFSDIAARESSVSTSASDIPSVEYEDVVAEEGRLNKDIRLKEAVKSGITFDGSQVLYGKLRPYLHNWLNPDFKGIAVGDWWVLKPINMDKNFLYRLIQTQQFDNIANQSSGSKMPRADWNLISNSEFMVPFSKEEQSKIGRCFDSLDHLITLHQRELEETKKKKKSLAKLLLTGSVRVPT